MAEHDNTQDNITESDSFKEITKYLDSHVGDFLRLTKEITEMTNTPFNIAVNYGPVPSPDKNTMFAGQISINVPKDVPESKAWTSFIISLKPILSSAITLIKKHHPDVNDEQLTNFIIGQCLDITKNTIKSNIQVQN